MDTRAVLPMLLILAAGCSTWRSLSAAPEDTTPPGLRIVPNEHFPPHPPTVPSEASVSGDMLYVARLVLLDR